MARFTNSNRVAAEEARVIDTRRPGMVQGGLVPVSRRPIDNLVFSPTSG